MCKLVSNFFVSFDWNLIPVFWLYTFETLPFNVLINVNRITQILCNNIFILVLMLYFLFLFNSFNIFFTPSLPINIDITWALHECFIYMDWNSWVWFCMNLEMQSNWLRGLGMCMLFLCIFLCTFLTCVVTYYDCTIYPLCFQNSPKPNKWFWLNCHSTCMPFVFNNSLMPEKWFL